MTVVTCNYMITNLTKQEIIFLSETGEASKDNDNNSINSSFNEDDNEEDICMKNTLTAFQLKLQDGIIKMLFKLCSSSWKGDTLVIYGDDE